MQYHSQRSNLGEIQFSSKTLLDIAKMAKLGSFRNADICCAQFILPNIPQIGFEHAAAPLTDWPRTKFPKLGPSRFCRCRLQHFVYQLPNPPSIHAAVTEQISDQSHCHLPHFVIKDRVYFATQASVVCSDSTDQSVMDRAFHSTGIYIWTF